jgi:hypothetical protein
VCTIIESPKPYILLALFLSIQDLLKGRWFKVSDKVARKKVGQDLRDASKALRASGKKQAAHGVKEASSDPSGLKKLFKEQPIHLPTLNTTVALQNTKDGVDFQESSRILFYNSSALSSSSVFDSHRQALQMIFGQNATSLYFDNQLSADLEPTPFQIKSTKRLPDLFNHGNVSKKSSRHFYDIDGGRASLTHDE